MAKIKVTLTDEHIALIKNLNIRKFQENDDAVAVVGINPFEMYGGSYKYEQIALILGYTDKAIEETEESIYGTVYEKDTQLHMEELDKYINANLLYIEEITHQFVDKGGLTAGTYVCKDYQHIWSKE